MAFELQRISHTHDQVMNWLILNPEKSLRECADHFHYTQTWLSTLIHSDVFQAKFRERSDAVFGRIMIDTKAKLEGLANMVTEQLATQLEANQDKDFTLDAFDKIMHRAGYAPASARNPAPQQQTNVFIGVDKDLLAAARNNMNKPQPATQPVTIEAETGTLSAPPPEPATPNVSELQAFAHAVMAPTESN